MDYVALKQIISDYKSNFSRIREEEDYKWKAVRHFQENWQIDVENFAEMLKISLNKTHNLLAVGSFPRDTICEMAKWEPEKVKTLFIKLYDEKVDVTERIESFLLDAEIIYNMIIDSKKEVSKTFKRGCQQDAKAVTVYLLLRYPEKYYIYKWNKYKLFADCIKAEIVSGRPLEKVKKYFELCDVVLNFIQNDKELLELNLVRQSEWPKADNKLHLLVDDIIYFGSRMNCIAENDFIPKSKEYTPGISVEKWLELLHDKKVFNDTSLYIMKMFLEQDDRSTCVNLSRVYGKGVLTYNHFNAECIALAGRVRKATNCIAYKNAKEEEKFWPILFLGKNVIEDEDRKRFLWKLRPELKEALMEMDLSKYNTDCYVGRLKKIPENIILYGPPGTGKTYNAVNYAVAIIEGKSFDEIKNENRSEVKKRFDVYKDSSNNRIECITFHQSYSYEEFIEGIRPILETADEADMSDSESKLKYKLEDGVFKQFCNKARNSEVLKEIGYGLRDNAVIWKVSLMGTGENLVRKDCFDDAHERIRIGWSEYGKDIDFEKCSFAVGGKAILKQFIETMQIGDIVFSCYSEDTIDGIGVVTGEYEWIESINNDYQRSRKVKWLVKGIRENIRQLNGGIAMTLSTIYKLNRITVADALAIVKKYSSNSFVNDNEPFVFIIDEINRGNISKIFGELITLIEPSKRIGAEEELRMKLPYSKKEFGIPKNVYIVGTMNTADRSIAFIDTALRRRFTFIEMQPKASNLENIRIVDDEGNNTSINLSEMLATMNDKIELLYDREHTIGHAYFTCLAPKATVTDLRHIFEFKIIPLLQEYFYDDYEKISFVLSDKRNDETDRLISVKYCHDNDLLSLYNFDLDDGGIKRLNFKALEKITFYTNIY